MSAGAQSHPASAEMDTNQALREWQDAHQSKNQPKWDTARLALRITSLIIAVPLFGLSIAGCVGPSSFRTFSIMGIALGLAIIIFDTASFITTCVRKRKSGIRPVVSLAFELIISMGGIAISTLLVFSATDATSYYVYYVSSGSGRPYLPVYSSNGYRYWLGASLSSSIFAIVLTLIHFTLFVRDCVEVDRERKATKRFFQRVASKNTRLERESTVERPAPAYKARERELENQRASELAYDYNEPSKYAFTGTYGDNPRDFPVEPKSLG